MAFEGRLVVFYREDVVCFFLLYEIAGGGLLSVERIRGDDPPFDGQRVQKRFEDGDFVGMLGNGLLSHDGGSLMEESSKDVGLAAIRGAGSLEGFSIDCDSGVRRADSFRPTHEAKIDGFSVNGLDKAADGGFTGGHVASGFLVATAQESLEHVLRAGLGPLSDGSKAVGTADECTDRDGKDGELLVAHTPGHSRVGYGAECLQEELGISDGEFHGFGLRVELDGKVWIGKPLGCVRSQCSDEYELGAAVVSVATGVPGEPSGISQTDPSCSLVAGASEEAWINEGFHEPYGMAISIVPVLGQAIDVECEDTGSEIVYPHTWEDQETEVVGHKGKPVPFQSSGPANPLVSGFAAQSWGCPPQQSDPLFFVYRHVAERFTDEALKSEVVVFAHELRPQTPLRVADEANLHPVDQSLSILIIRPAIVFHAPLDSKGRQECPEKSTLVRIPCAWAQV